MSKSALRLNLVCGVLFLAISGCSVFPSFLRGASPVEQTYFLEPGTEVSGGGQKNCGDIQVGAVIPAPGFRGSRMAYSTQPLTIEYYAYARWADSVGRLLAAPLRKGLMASGRFDNVISAPTLVQTDFRLEFADLRVIQTFSSPDAQESVQQLNVQARLFQVEPPRLLDSREFSYERNSAPNPKAGVEATNLLAAHLVRDLTTFVATHCPSE